MRRGGGGRPAREGLARRTLKVAAALILFVSICAPIAASIVPSHNHEGLVAGRRYRAARKALSPMPTLAATGDIHVNAATKDELIMIKGVGPALAESIIAEREQNGRFCFPEDLLSVKGIGRKTLMELLNQITLK